MTFAFGTSTGYGPVRKTKKSAQREADLWNASGDGRRYLCSERTNVTPTIPAHYESCVTEVQTVEGGFVCAYVTTREPLGSCEWFAQTGVLLHCAGSQPATTTVDHPGIGRIPTCADCARKAGA